ncbi:hypothetical protein TRFO_09320 [Tritrichomonas foetus]|uniref:TOG domain-containing protein n=1 Tax=Tritrichomonas foetus TaxID=1144522 RepID=A0A1J4JJ84_9EUKA|nr:hypothetical protein TRFO_09320 [Tritrichomonas foetus]|eukprot:OHS97621.1 hypothetical protein TRFO_09320 [Tritrichomonas foetus]
MSFTAQSESKLEKIREIHASFLSKEVDNASFLKSLTKINYNTTECALAIVSALSSAVLYSNISESINHFSRVFSSLLSNSDEVVRRSCLMTVSILSQKKQLNVLLKEFIRLFPSWNERAQEMLLSFAFSFSSPAVESFKVLLPLAESVKNSNDELLASTASDFIIYIQTPQNESSNEPKAVMMLRSSVDLSKLHDTIHAYNSSYTFDDLPDDDDDDALYNAEPPAGKAIIRNSVTFKKSAPVSKPNMEDEFEEEDDEENGDPPPGKSLLRNSADLKNITLNKSKQNNSSKYTKTNSYDDEFEEDEIEEEKYQPKKPIKKLNQIPKPKTAPPKTVTPNRQPKGKESFDDNPFDDDDLIDEPKQINPPIYKRAPKTAIPSSTKVAKSSKINDSNSPTANTKSARNSLPNKPEKSEQKKVKLPPVSDLVADLRSKDWEKQQSSIEMLSSILLSDPTPLAGLCKEIWLNLLDVILSPRTTLGNLALQFTASFYQEFSAQLCPQTQQIIGSTLNLCCSSHQFIADGAASVLLTIAENSPKNRVFKTFMTGLKHKNSLARAKAMQCLAIVIENEALEDNEIKSIISTAAPLLRDTRVETRDAAKRVLKVLSNDEKFTQIAKSTLKSVQDYNEMKRMIETS